MVKLGGILCRSVAMAAVVALVAACQSNKLSREGAQRLLTQSSWAASSDVSDIYVTLCGPICDRQGAKAITLDCNKHGAPISVNLTPLGEQVFQSAKIISMCGGVLKIKEPVRRSIIEITGIADMPPDGHVKRIDPHPV